MDITWKIEQCEYDLETGGITAAHWRVTAVDGDIVVSTYGSCDFKPAADSADFKPFADVTEADVLSWVWGSVPKEDTETGLKVRMEAKKQPVTTTGVPWV